MSETTAKETFKIAGNHLVEAVKKLLHEGNVRRVIIKKDGHTVAEFPLSLGVIGAVLAPILAAVAAIATLVGECTVEVERVVEPNAKKEGAA
jgi:hypothetical protein